MTITTEPTATRVGRASGRRHRSVDGLPPNIFPESGVVELTEEEVARRTAAEAEARDEEDLDLEDDDAADFGETEDVPVGGEFLVPEDEADVHAATAPNTTERTLITGGNPDELYPTPFLSKDFADAPDLAEIGAALIEHLDEFEELRAAMEEKDIAIRYLWRKKAAKQADRVKAGTLGKAGGLVKHFARGEYVVQVAADAAYGKTRWQIEALVMHELLHIKIEMVLKGPKGAKVEVPQLKTRAHDLEMFWAEVERYGLWRRDLEQAEEVFKIRQTSLGLA